MPKILLLLIPALFLFSCEKNESSGTSSSSHNTGKNCLGCHSFKAAGSVYNQDFSATVQNAVVTLTTEANGGETVISTYTTDKTGNFYTSSSISFGSGLYVSVKSSGGTTHYMSSAITSGACNSCHTGSGTNRVWAE